LIPIFAVKGSLWNTVQNITLEHSEKHHFGTQQLLDSFRTQNATSLQTTANKQNIRFTDRRSTVEGSHVPKQYLYQETTPTIDLVLTSSLPLSWLGIHYAQLPCHLGFIWGGRGGFHNQPFKVYLRGEHSTYIITSVVFKG